MNTIQISNMRQKTSILDKSISKGKGEINMNCFALMFSELVQYCQGKAHTVNELQTRLLHTFWWHFVPQLIYTFSSRLSDLGQEVGTKLIDLHFVREKNSKREIKLLNMLLFIKSTFWKVWSNILIKKTNRNYYCILFYNQYQICRIFLVVKLIN
jgi:hypothetical protein